MNNSVLIADSCETALIFELLLFSSTTIKCRLARSGNELFATLKTHKPDLILLDAGLTEIDGNECCRRLKHDPALAGIPVIMMTIRGQEEQMQAAIDAGCNSFLPKPLDKNVLLEICRKMGLDFSPKDTQENNSFV